MQPDDSQVYLAFNLTTNRHVSINRTLDGAKMILRKLYGIPINSWREYPPSSWFEESDHRFAIHLVPLED